MRCTALAHQEPSRPAEADKTGRIRAEGAPDMLGGSTITLIEQEIRARVNPEQTQSLHNRVPQACSFWRFFFSYWRAYGRGIINTSTWITLNLLLHETFGDGSSSFFFSLTVLSFSRCAASRAKSRTEASTAPPSHPTTHLFPTVSVTVKRKKVRRQRLG